MHKPPHPADMDEAKEIIEAQWRQIGELSRSISDYISGGNDLYSLIKAVVDHGDIDAENDARVAADRKDKP